MTTPSYVPQVLFVSSHAELGGSERYLLRLLELLGPAVSAHVVALADGPLVESLRAADVPVDVVATGRRLGLLRGAAALSSYVGRIQPHVIHANGVKAALVVALTRRRRTPVVWVKHDHARDGRLGRFVARRCAVVVGVSRSVLRNIPAGTDAVVIPPGVTMAHADPVLARPQLRHELGAAAAAPVLLCVGRLDPAKGYDDAVRVLAGVVRTCPDAHLAVAGATDPHHPRVAEQLRALAAEQGLAGRVHLLGARDDVPALLAAADVVLVTSRAVDRAGMGEEGFGLVAAEALLAGTPVAGFSAGALPEVVGECGRLVSPGQVDALVLRVAELLADPSARAAMADCGRRRAAQFDPQTWCAAMLEVYRRLSPSSTR